MIRPMCILLTAVLAIVPFAGVLSAGEANLKLMGLGDGEKLTKDQAIPASRHFWDPAAKTLTMHGGRNEVVAAQLMLVAGKDVKSVNVEIGDLKGPGTIPADKNIELFLELYQYVKDGSYTWGPPKSKVLPSKKWYPEVLVPFRDPYDPKRKPVGAPFDITTDLGPNQGVWVDIYIPRDAAPGKYEAPIRVTVGKKVVITAKLVLTVNDFTIPDETHVDGYGEMYGRAYMFHDLKYGQVPVDQWWKVAGRYHQMAHRHRFVIAERFNVGPNPFREKTGWANYDKTYGTLLDGSLFTKERGYYGPGEGVAVSFWRAPFFQRYNSSVPNFTKAQLAKYTEQAKAFWDHVVKKGWDKNRRFMVYIIDEAGNGAWARKNEKKLQDALDAGAGKGNLNLMWTSHTNPASLAKYPRRDKRGLIRWWAPNGHACDPAFLSPRVKLGETVWVYHSGQPAVGVHVVNATGVELRTWGTICWRYKLNGSFWWAMDMGDKNEPLSKPKYKPAETRWGNGVLFYPGAMLPDVDLPPIDGPLSSMRMKAYRRGLQDYEYAWLLKQKGKGDVADKIIRRIIPIALTEAVDQMKAFKGEPVKKRDRYDEGIYPKERLEKGDPPWATNVDAWYQMRKDLAAELLKK